VKSFNICEKVAKNSSFYIEMPVFFTNIFEQWLKTAAHAQWMWSRLSMCSIDLSKKVAHRGSQRDVFYLGW
jgi:hypothetical protein